MHRLPFLLLLCGSLYPSPGHAQTPAPADVVLNELAYAPPDAALEYVELFNRAATAFDLSRFTLADSRRAPVALTRTPTLLAPGDYVVLVRDSLAMAAAFPDVPTLEVAGWPVLNNGGDTVLLFYEGTLIDSVAYDPAWGGDGVALERRDPAGSANDGANWADSTDPSGGTPGRANSVFFTDNTPPALLSVIPAPEGDRLLLRFDEPLDPTRLAPASFRVSQAGVLRPTESILHDGDDVTLTFDPVLEAGDYVLTVSEVADLAGNVLAEAALPFTVLPVAIPSLGDVVINEVMYAPPAGGSEYIELYNRSAETYDLSGFTLADNRGQPVAVTTVPTALPPGGYAVLVRDSAAFAAAFPGVVFGTVASWPALNNSGDDVVLGWGETVLEQVRYTSAWGGSGVALERIDPTGTATSSANWAESTDARGGTPGAQNSRFFIDTQAPVALFAEQTAPRSLQVGFDEPLDASTLTSATLRLDGLAPTTLHLDDTGYTVHADFADEVTGQTIALEGFADLKGNRSSAASLPLARFAPVGQMVINEIMYDPRRDPQDGRIDQPEYVELYNASELLVTLQGLYFTETPDENGTSRTLRIGRSGAALAPGAYAVVFDIEVDPEDWYSQSALVLAFPADYQSMGSMLLPTEGGLSLTLPARGERLALRRADGVVVDSVAYDPRWHDDRIADPTGASLERLSAQGGSNDALNWTSSRAALGGTPGQDNSVRPATARPPVSGELLLNELLYAPLADDADGRPNQPEYLELFNPTDEALSLDGLFLTDAPDEQGQADTLRLVYGPTVLPAGGYAVVYAVPSGTPDDRLGAVLTSAFSAVGSSNALLLAQRSSLGLGNEGDTIRLHRADGLLLEEVSYAPGWHHVALRDDTGIALERIDATVTSDRGENWTSSVDPAGGTPGQPNSVALPALASEQPVGLAIAPSPFSPDRDGFDDVAAIRFQLRTNAALVRARIFDAHGRLVRTLEPAQLAAQSGTLLWDGLGERQQSLRIGIYIVLLEAVAADQGIAERYQAPVVLARSLH